MRKSISKLMALHLPEKSQGQTQGQCERQPHMGSADHVCWGPPTVMMGGAVSVMMGEEALPKAWGLGTQGAHFCCHCPSQE